MKKTILTFLIFWGSFTSIIAQDSDYAAVEKTVNYYLNGGTNGDYKTLAKAFHKNATMKYIRNGEYTEVNALAFFKKVIKPGKKSTRTTKVTSITVAGDAANAVLRIDYATFSFTDYMNLLKIDGEWKVVNKIFYKNKKE